MAGGIALGLHRIALVPLAVASPILLLVLSEFRSRPVSSLLTGAPRPDRPLLLLALIVASGSLLGARSGDSLRRACEASLESGIGVRVRGIVAEDVVPAASGSETSRSLRIGLESAILSADSGACTLPRLTVFLEGRRAPLWAGEFVVLEGEWLRLRANSTLGAAIDLPGHVGILVGGRLLDAGPAHSPGKAGPGSGRLSSLRRAARSAASRRLRARLPSQVNPIARALLLAERDELPSDLRRRFADAGLAHLLAISGLHVGIIAALVLALLTPLVGGRNRYPLAAGAVGLYVAVLGAPVSALRASLLFGGWAIARSRGVPIRGADLLGATALVFLVGEPATLVSPGFQLSFAGYAGVSLGLSACRGMLARRDEAARRGAGAACAKAVRGVAMALSTGAGAFLATCPIAAWHFGRVAPVSVVSNLVGTPIVALSIWSLLGAMLPGPLGVPFAVSATAFLTLLEALAGWFGGGTASQFDVSPPTLDVWMAWSLGFAVLTWTARGASPARILLPSAAAVSLLIAQPAKRIRALTDHGMLCILSVGQGDAGILRTHGGRWLVFDGGPTSRPGPGREEIRTALRRRGAENVALVTLSHPDLDHIGGLEGLLTDLPVGAVLDTGDPLPREAYARLLTLAEETGVEWLQARSGVRVRVDEVEILVLGPDSSRATDPTGRGASANETSLIFRLTAGGFRYINSGDATAEQERRVLSAWPVDSLRADLLKIGHHGSRTSTSMDWISAVRPTVAVISAGPGNRFGHPHPEVLDRIGQSKVPLLWRTDRRGTLCIQYRTDGRWRIARESAWNRPATHKVTGRHED